MSEAAEGTRIVQGQVGQIAGHSVGVEQVEASGSSARIVVAGSTSGVAWEIAADLRPHELLPVCEGAFAVAAITPGPDGSGGAVEIRGRADASAPTGAICVPAGARLRIGGASVMTATDFSITAWRPDERTPASVQAEWYPARLERQDTPASDIHPVTVQSGGTASIGTWRVRAVAIHGATERRRAWLILELEK